MVTFACKVTICCKKSSIKYLKRIVIREINGLPLGEEEVDARLKSVLDCIMAEINNPVRYL